MKALTMKAARIMKNMTQFDLARASGLSEAQVSKIETGRAMPDYDTRKRIADVLDIPPALVGIYVPRKST
jgi:transcriptional regulator with XRE-family HTH domain